MQYKSNEISNLHNKLKYFLSVLAFICVVGIIMVYSTSYMYAKEHFNSSIYFAGRQLLFLGMGVLLTFVVSKTKFRFWMQYAPYINLCCSLLLIFTFIPGLSVTTKGASRWISFGVFNLQPGEFVKYSLILASLSYFENFARLDQRERIKQALFLLLPLILLVLQPDFGSFSICFLVIMFVCFMSSFPRKYFYTLIGSGTVLAGIILMMESYRVRRLFSFLDPWKNPQTSGFQIIQSFLAFAKGAFWGTGLGNSNEKLFYLPEAHNDFIFSVIGEELGFVGVLAMIAVFVMFLYFGFRLAEYMSQKVLSIIIASVVFTVGIQALLNMGVVLGLLPTKGMNLPFVSYGGSSLLANFFGVGLILSAVRQAEKDKSLPLQHS